MLFSPNLLTLALLASAAVVHGQTCKLSSFMISNADGTFAHSLAPNSFTALCLPTDPRLTIEAVADACVDSVVLTLSKNNTGNGGVVGRKAVKKGRKAVKKGRKAVKKDGKGDKGGRVRRLATIATPTENSAPYYLFGDTLPTGGTSTVTYKSIFVAGERYVIEATPDGDSTKTITAQFTLADPGFDGCR
jgi:hypothetical protein